MTANSSTKNSAALFLSPVQHNGYKNHLRISGYRQKCFHRSKPDFLDSDSSLYSWIRDKAGSIQKDAYGTPVRHPDFPDNYLAHIVSRKGKVPGILVSSHKEVRDALVAYHMPFALVYPARELLQEYIERYQKRGSPKEFIEKMTTNWEEFIDDMDAQPGCEKIVLSAGQYLNDVIGKINVAGG